MPSVLEVTGGAAETVSVAAAAKFHWKFVVTSWRTRKYVAPAGRLNVEKGIATDTGATEEVETVTGPAITLAAVAAGPTALVM